MNNQTEGMGRDDFIIAKALWEASKVLALRPDVERPDSDIEDMRAILETRYPGWAGQFAYIDDLVRAVRLGMPIEEGKPVRSEDVKAFLDGQKPREV